MHVTFPSADLTLEGHLTLPPGATRAGVICHPHPQYGGDMHNPVVGAIEAGLQRAGFATLRFNFRGVGRSTGAYDGGSGEPSVARFGRAPVYGVIFCGVNAWLVGKYVTVVASRSKSFMST